MFRVGVECGVKSCVGGVTSKLSGFCGCVHGACGSMYGVTLCCSLVQCDVMMSMTSCGVLWIVMVIGCLSAVTMGWSLALGRSPALILRLLW